MKTEWDYTELANAYLKRPDYADAAIDAMLAVAGIGTGARVCDIGAGVAHLTLMLAKRGLDVTAVEPNDAMRENGSGRTALLNNVKWFEGTGENTLQPEQSFDLVTFGSSFNVCDTASALRETARILKPGGYFSCLWNHRRLDDPVQARIEEIIRSHLPGYEYGTRRQDQTSTIDCSGLFGPVIRIEANVTHQQSVEECVEAWRSHATLARQAGKIFPDIVQGIESYLGGLDRETLEIPYSTNLWLAKLR